MVGRVFSFVKRLIRNDYVLLSVIVSLPSDG